MRAVGPCGSMESKREYARLGFVKREKQCLCCRAVLWDSPPVRGQRGISPGFPCCNKKQTLEITNALRARMYRRGTIGQIRKHEAMVPQLEEALRAATALTEAAQVGAPSTKMMDRTYKTFNDKEYDMTNTCESIVGCILTCGCAGFQKETIKLTQDAIYHVEKDNFDESTMEMPYAQLDSIDVSRSMCCFYSINDETPGWGCEKEKVEELAADLKQRVVERGNIAQLEQLQHILSVVTTLEAKMRILVVEGAGVEAPPHTAAPHGNDFVEAFEAQHYNFSDPVESAGLCCSSFGLTGPCTTRAVNLEPEEIEVTMKNWAVQTTKRTPYASLDGTDIDENFCGACLDVDEVGTATCGCGTKELRSINENLETRIKKRGNIAQLKLQDNIIAEVRQVNALVAKFKGAKGI